MATNMNLWQMSLCGAVFIIVIIIIRAVFINRLPKKTFLWLWSLALLRLSVPFSIPYTFSVYSLFNTNKLAQKTLSAGSPFSEAMPPFTIPSDALSASPLPAEPNFTFSWKVIWFLGCLVFAFIFIFCYAICLHNFKTSLPVFSDYIQTWLKEHPIRRKVSVRQSDRISSPLTYGIFRPVILLPKSADLSNRQQLDFIFEHEFVHICRFDLITKLIACIVLCIHWFNPFVWMLYFLLNKDLELACDEAVIHKWDKSTRVEYARTLICLEEKRTVSPLLFNSFSKNIMEERIVAIMKPKKFTLPASVGAFALITLVSAVFLTSASAAEADKNPSSAGTFAEKGTDNFISGTQTDDILYVPNSESSSDLPEEPTTESDTNKESSFAMFWPTKSTTLSSSFGTRVHPVTGESFTNDHICIAGEKGDAVCSAISGTVIECSFHFSFGNYIVITDENGISTFYGHLESSDVSVGDFVTAGNKIGKLGATGMATGPNLSFGVTVNGEPVDPMNYFNH